MPPADAFLCLNMQASGGVCGPGGLHVQQLRLLQPTVRTIQIYLLVCTDRSRRGNTLHRKDAMHL